MGDKNVASNIYKLQAHNLIMCRYFHIGFTLLKGKSLLDYTNLFSPNEYEKNNKIILKYFQFLKMLGWQKYILLFVGSIENLKFGHHTF